MSDTSHRASNGEPTEGADEVLGTLQSVDEAAMGRLHERLVRSAEVDHLVDLAYRRVDSPVGALLLVATDRGLVRVAFAAEDHDAVLAQLAARISPRILRAPGRLDDVARQLEEYFERGRRQFALDLDLQLSTGFRREVLEHLPDISYGHTASYGSVAQLAGRPTAVRAVGTACATNPLPIVIPCHRVLRSDGSLGGYLGGIAAKRTLLDLETAPVAH